MKSLTTRQAHILSFISASSPPPSIREIGTEFGIGSLRGVTVHLDALVRKGYLLRVPGPRGLVVLKDVEGQKGRFVFVLDKPSRKATSLEVRGCGVEAKL